MSEMVGIVAETIRQHTADATWAPEGLALAIIEAMREPTEAMLAKVSGGAAYTNGLAYQMHRASWRAMIDAAVTQQLPPTPAMLAEAFK